MLRPQENWKQSWQLRDSQGWYDLTFSVEQDKFLRQLAGHVESGRDSMSDPLFGG